MKTTLEIPDPIFRQAKVRAGALGIPLREYITQAVEEKLSGRRKQGSKPWMAHAGELAHLHEETLRIDRIIEEAFEQIEPEEQRRHPAGIETIGKTDTGERSLDRSS